MRINHPVSFQRIANALIILALSILLLIVGKTLLVPLAFGGLFAFVLHPVCRFYERFIPNRILSIFITFLTVLLPVLGLMFFFGYEFYRLVNGITTIENQLKEGLNSILNWLQQNWNLGLQEIRQWIQANISTLIDTPLSFITNSLTSSTTLLAGLFLSAIYTFFFLLYRTSFKSFFIYQFGPQTREEARTILADIQQVMQEYLFGLGLVIIILGILNGTGLWLIGIDYAYFWGFLGALLAIIPYIGTTLGGLFPFLYAILTTQTVWQPVAVVALYFGVQQIEGNFITPKVVGSSVRVNPLAAIISLLIGGLLWGIAGLILAIPFVAVLKVIFSHIDYLKPFGQLLGDKLYRNSQVFKSDYDEDKYRLFNMFKKQELARKDKVEEE